MQDQGASGSSHPELPGEVVENIAAVMHDREVTEAVIAWASRLERPADPEGLREQIAKARSYLEAAREVAERAAAGSTRDAESLPMARLTVLDAANKIWHCAAVGPLPLPPRLTLKNAFQVQRGVDMLIDAGREQRGES